MKDSESDKLEITAELLLRAYVHGIFPMADGANANEIYWVEPRVRGILPLEGFRISRSLRKRLRKNDHLVTIDNSFAQVVAACAARPDTWINAEIAALYNDLFALGHAHSVEVWQDDVLVGGVYGVCLGQAFFGESMFSRVTDGSKIALTYLVSRLKAGGFTLFDTQFTTPHLKTLGAINLPQARYRELLEESLSGQADFYCLSEDAAAERVLQEISQTS